MKKQILLITLLMALLAPMAMNGQQTLVVANGTGTNNEIPFYGLYADDNYQHTQTIYPSSMLTAMQGGTITKLTYHLSSSVTQDYGSTFEVRLGTTNSTSFSTGTVNYISMTGSPAYSNTLSVNGTTVEFNLSTPYTYNSGNLVVDVRISNKASGYNSTYFYGESGSINYSVKNRSTSSLPTSTGTAVTFMPKTTFTYLTSDPYITLTPTTATVLTGFTQTLTATYGNVSGTPTITYSSSNTSVATVSGSGTTATVTAVAPGTATITATMNGSYTATCAITVEDPSYCTPSYSQTSDYIKSFVTTGGATNINNTNTGQGTGGYSDFYDSHSARINAGETLSFTVTRGYSDSYKYAIWVDWNNDYVFDVNTETMAQQTTSVSSDWSSSFTVPAGTPAGDYRMRVEMLYGSSNTLNPCVSASYGEVEDYKLTVLSSGAYTITCATTTGGTISADKTNADENDVVTITATPETDYLLTALTYTPEGGSAQNIDITNMPYTFTMPAANVTVNATFSLPACPRPTNLTVSNLAASHANVSWDSEAGNYTVKYSTATVSGTTLDPVFEDGFENGLGSWTTYALDYSNTSTNWHQYNMTNLGSNGVYETNHSGSYSAMSRSYDGNLDRSVDNWLITPQMTLGDVVKFYMNTNEDFPDSYAVYVSTGSNTVTSSSSIGDFELVQNYVNAPLEWDEVSIDISAYAGQTGYVAIRHTTYGGDFICVDDFGVYNTINTYSYGGWTTVSPNPTTNSCQITGLSAETLYEVQVQANCGGNDGSSAWSSVMFTTPDNCGAPQELASSDITATSATLSWADDKDSYNLRYRKVYFYEGFEGGNMPTGWTVINANDDDLTWSIGYTTVHSGAYGAYDWSYVYQQSGISPDDYLVSPLLDLQGTLRVWLSGYGSNATEHYAILLSTTGNSASDFTTTLLEGNTTAQYAEVSCDLSSYEGQQGYIAIRHYNCTDQRHLYVDDFGLYGSENWVALNPNPTTETANLTGLTPNTGYEWQVQGVNCDGNGGTTEWSTVATFSTLEGYTKDITAYTTNGGYYLIASPLASPVTPANVTNMISNTTYDLYRFNQSNSATEWENYKKGHFTTLENGKGYLYANSNNVTLVFTGAAYNGNGKIDLTQDASNTTRGNWNLVGNPYPETANIGSTPYYKMKADGSDIESTTGGTIAPMEAVFVLYDSENSVTSVTFAKGAPSKSSEQLTLNVSQGRSNVIDRAIIRFDESSQLDKFQLFENSTKIYIPQSTKEYAVVSAEAQGEMPVNFEATSNGTYTLSVNAENVEFSYLHLIDNMTGAEVDLLETPSYSFNATTSDYSSRFKLVFAQGNNSNSDEFAFISNGNIIVNGEGMLQVIDMTGRIISTSQINGVSSLNLNAAAGVYVLQLTNGENVKTQKIVVK